MKGFPFGFALVFAVAVALLAALIDYCVTFHHVSGDAAFGQGFEALMIVAALWLVLAALLIVAGVMGKMPGLGVGLAIVLTPLSGVASFAAVDLVSRNQPGAALFPALLAALVAYYAFWARLPTLRAKSRPIPTSLTVWGFVLALSVLTLFAAAA